MILQVLICNSMKTNIAVVNDQNSLCLHRLTQFYKTRLQTGRCTAPPLTSSRMHTTSRRRSQHRAGFCCKRNLACAATERPSHPVLIQKKGKRCFAYMVTEATDVHKQCIQTVYKWSSTTNMAKHIDRDKHHSLFEKF